MSSSITFHLDPTNPSAGANFRVYVDTAPCNPATVTAFANGVQIGSPQQCSVGNSVQFLCPAGTSGRQWKVTVECPTDSLTKTGTIQ
jgi:hypothetical protein